MQVYEEFGQLAFSTKQKFDESDPLFGKPFFKQQAEFNYSQIESEHT
jgi:hypothetical protein